MRFFRPEIERPLKMLAVLTLIGLVVLPVAWGYEQRRQARSWQKLACIYRVREVVSRAPLLGTVNVGPDACATLSRLGFELERPQ